MPKFGFDVTSLHPTVRTQSHNANAPAFVWREVAWRDAFTTGMLKNTKYNIKVFVGCVYKRRKKSKREKKKTKKRRRLSKV